MARTEGALCGIDEINGHDFDYVIVGGGTAGLAVAARLTENPSVKVAVLEAGSNHMEDKQISTPSLYPTLIGREKYDWCYNSIPQETAGNKPYSMPRGRVLGGSSAINYLMYVRGSRKDYDGWEAMGNKGWGWEGMLPYFRKHQTLDAPSKPPVDAQFMPHAAKEKYHGIDGPIHTSFNDHFMPLEEDFVQAAFAVGGTPNTLHDAWSGDHYGFYSSLGAVDRTHDKGNRSYAATGYLKPNLGRPNLRVLVDAHASRIVLKQHEGGAEPVARGVEFLHRETKYTVQASREVILCGGVIGTPQLLELSGIGDRRILEQAGIECIVSNDKVGANFQDHVLGGMLFDLQDGIKSMDELHNEEYAKAQQKIYDESRQGPYGSPGMLMGFVSYASIVDKPTLDATLSSIRENSLAESIFERTQEKVIVDQLTDPTFANIQTFCIPCRLDLSAGNSQIQFFSAPPKGVNQVSLLVCLEHPLSRGSVHITSSDPLDHPRIDPGYFRNEADLKIMAAGIAWMDKVSQHPLLQKSLGRRVQPAEDYSLATEEARMEYVRNHISTQYHLIGTASMGQVVDDRLKVYGIQGLRVVDASVLPTHVSGNIMSTVYALAEKAADIIKEDDGRYDFGRVDSVVE